MNAPEAAAGARLGAARQRVRDELLRASAALDEEGVPGSDAHGQLIRPLVALAGVRDPDAPPPGFWQAVLAVQLAHEASLVHDDIMDAADERRGVPTAAARKGVAAALLLGDHLLTAAFRASAGTGNLEFVSLFARAVERTVAAEAEQARSAGVELQHERYERIALGKAGELLGCALATAPSLEGRADASDLFELGRRLGLVYQMLDDLLDYCPRAETGKPSLSDYAQRRWTWVLAEAPEVGFGRESEEVLAALHGSRDGASPMQRALTRLEREAASLEHDLLDRLPGDDLISAMLAAWMARARQAVLQEAKTRTAPKRGPASGPPPARHRCATGSANSAEMRALQERVPELTGVEEYLALHSRSFRFASRFFPTSERQKVARVYAFCRITDDLTDLPPATCGSHDLLELWLDLAHAAYRGEPSRFPLLDRVMAEMATARAPIVYVDELVEGMRMDLRGERYDTLSDLRRYTYRVASVVGLWLTRLCGVHDAGILARAEQMGHAMQFTNILRDVGEDWDRGRLYLPADLLRKHGLDEGRLARMRAGEPICDAYRSALEEMMAAAERDYADALEALPALPGWFSRPVAVAAHVYRGIHGRIRRNDYDNLRRRAYTSTATKGMLAGRALWELHRAHASWTPDAVGMVGLSGGSE